MVDLKLERQNNIVLAMMNFTSIPEQTFMTLLNKCTVNEQSSILKYKHRIDQLRSLLSIIQIKYCFKNYLKWENEIAIIKDTNGKPKINGWKGDISISHSGEWIFTGICTNGTIGVDIECLYPFPFIKGSEELFLSEKELSFFKEIQSLEKSKHYLLTTWTLKEAYIKERGIGLKLINPTTLSLNYTPQKNCFIYQGHEGLSKLITFVVEGAAIASFSTSNIDRPSLQFYKYNQRDMLSKISFTSPS